MNFELIKVAKYSQLIMTLYSKIVISGHQQPNLILEKAKKASDPSSLWTSFVNAILGHGKYLSRTENLIHALGSITALCCTDKKGILSWPNTSAEKLFILKTEDTSGPTSVSATVPTTVQAPTGNASGDGPDVTSVGSGEPPKVTEAAGKGQDLVPEILTITHDHRNPFKVDFDDPTWRQYITSLKPLGLSILLNTCNLSTEVSSWKYIYYSSA